MARSAIAMALALILAAPVLAGQSAEPVPALPRAGAIAILDTPRGTVWDVIYPPGIPTPLHYHATDLFGVELVATRVRLTGTDGSVRLVDLQRGGMTMVHKGLTHIEESLIGHPQRNAIVIELKDAPSRTYPPGTPSADFAAMGARQVVDDKRLTAWDMSWAPDATAVPFYQARDLFLLPIDTGILSIATDGAPATAMPVAGGQALFLPGGHRHMITATGGAVRVAVVELK